jgi:hypothetical protein
VGVLQVWSDWMGMKGFSGQGCIHHGPDLA